MVSAKHLYLMFASKSLEMLQAVLSLYPEDQKFKELCHLNNMKENVLFHAVKYGNTQLATVLALYPNELQLSQLFHQSMSGENALMQVKWVENLELKKKIIQIIVKLCPDDSVPIFIGTYI